MERLDDIPGIGRTAASVILSEIGLDMTRFPTAGHLASWARFAPTMKESAGSPSAAPSSPSAGTCCPTPTLTSSTWAPASTTPASAPNARNAITSASPKPWATESSWNPPPDRLT
ncbi:transposase [Nonomuraea sp. JJY05]|uniref:transposase n=1 Tax=Nonomuraea sp. JJY05 TaxID=3350255 RepID=UPI00373F7010